MISWTWVIGRAYSSSPSENTTSCCAACPVPLASVLDMGPPWEKSDASPLIDRRRAVLSTRFGSSDPLQGRPRDADALSVNVRDQVVDLVDELPANGAVAARVASLCDDPSSSAAGVAHEAARDEALVALLLRMANSAACA